MHKYMPVSPSDAYFIGKNALSYREFLDWMVQCDSKCIYNYIKLETQIYMVKTHLCIKRCLLICLNGRAEFKYKFHKTSARLAEDTSEKNLDVYTFQKGKVYQILKTYKLDRLEPN